MSDDEEFLQSLREMFKIEAEEHLSAMSAGLIELEKDLSAEVEAETIETTFREVHSLKGAARAVDQTDIEALCQPLETVMSAWKRHEMRPSVTVFDIFYRAIDVMKGVIATPDGETSPAQAQVQALVQQLNKMESGANGDPVPAVKSEPTDQSPLPAAVSIPGLAAFPAADGDAPYPLRAASSAPVTPPPAPSNGPLPVQVNPPTQTVSTAPAVSAPLLSRTPVPQPDGGGRIPPQSSSEKPAGPQTIRISTAKLDALLLQVEEMLSVKLTTGQRAADLHSIEASMALWKKDWAGMDETIRDLRRSAGQNGLSDSTDSASTPSGRLLEFMDAGRERMRSLEGKITALARQVEQDRRDTGARVDYLLEDMKHTLMLPCATLLDVFPKLVRDLARDQGKEVEITLRGREVDMDRRILEELKDPLIHILRNCVDHGLEKPDVRTQGNKPARGTLSLSVTPVDGSKVEILITDDGAGIDGNRVKEAAVRLGVLSQMDADKLDGEAAVPLIFQSALSTSPIITDLSGRGLGLAIAREKVEKLGGKISVETEVHRGTVFRIVLPVALSTFRGIIVEVSGRPFVLPAVNVEAVVRVKHDEIRTVENQETILLKREAIPLVQLAEVLELSAGPAKDRAKGYSFAAVLAAGDRRVAFGVDAILNEQE
nr:ATP-binding protein [Armatimonadota bacterium]